MRTLAALAFAVSVPAAARPARAETLPLPPPPVVISAPREDVWAALTTAEGIAATGGGKAIVDLRPGGAIRRHPDPDARVEAEGWTSRPVLAFAAPRLLVLGEDTPSAWTVIELDALDGVRTRVRIEHVSTAEGGPAAAALEERDRALVAGLRARFPKAPDPVVAALTPLVGAWEERADAGGDVLARWTIVVDASDGPEASPSASLERKAAADGSTARWAFWREAESGRWIGGLVTGTRPAAWRIEPDRRGAIAWSNRWDECGGLRIWIPEPARDGPVTVETIQGCFGETSRWTRAPDAK